MSKEKSYYLISEVSELLGFSLQKLYYYEKLGIVVPERDETNQYRKYSLWDIHNLIIVRDLLHLNFSLTQIQQYFKQSTVASTLKLLNDEMNALNKEIDRLNKVKNQISLQLTGALNALHASKSQAVYVEEFEERPCLLISDHDVSYLSIDTTIIKYMQERNIKLDLANLCDCYTVDVRDKNEYGAYKSKNIFLYSPEPEYPPNYYLPAGKYLCLSYQNSTANTPNILPKMFEYAENNHLKVVGDPIEFCLIDEYFSGDDSEFVTMVQIRVE
ncbi:MerR family transcriptional regulator [Aminipila luticellarii]|uniref:MerR family transcriptional regulator n=1 Tax=Aminipila luticellarii TaxID=2507160 RepID=A0A410PWJ4_9FIRM|nr:MerR family transcriptional regulator [Aminipila luticellarii]QAT43285.1 MerR family transcriptional regulator [Aminipila luticellarii]